MITEINPKSSRHALSEPELKLDEYIAYLENTDTINYNSGWEVEIYCRREMKSRHKMLKTRAEKTV